MPADGRGYQNAETRIKPGFFGYEKAPENGVKSATNQKVGGSSPSWRASGKLPLPSRESHFVGFAIFLARVFH